MRWNLLSAFTFGMVLSSCVGTRQVQFYEGPPLPREKIARLAIPPNGLTRLDGRKPPEFLFFAGSIRGAKHMQTVDILPGRHVLRVDWVQIMALAENQRDMKGRVIRNPGELVYSTTYSTVESKHSKELVLDARPGGSYQMKWEEVNPGEPADPGTSLGGYMIQVPFDNYVKAGYRRVFIDTSLNRPGFKVTRSRLVLKDITQTDPF